VEANRIVRRSLLPLLRRATPASGQIVGMTTHFFAVIRGRGYAVALACGRFGKSGGRAAALQKGVVR